MSFYEIDKTESFLLSLLPAEIEPELESVLKQANENFVPVVSKTGAQLLKILVTLARPKKIIEIGTGIGYSGLIMLKNSDAHLHTVDFNEKNLALAKENFDKFGCGGRVTIMAGDASDLVPLMSGETDFIFLDGPKGRYHEYFPYLKKLLKPGGVLLADNVLYSGRISGRNETPQSKQTITERLGLFFELLKNDADTDTSVLPLGDGMSITIVK